MQEFATTYSEILQGPLFAALITLAGLLLAAHNVLVVNLHRDLYSDPEFREFNRQADKHRNPMDRLEGFSTRIRYCIWTCIIASVSQFTVGFIPHGYGATISTGLAVFAALFLVYIFTLQNQVITAWLSHLRVKADKEDERLAIERANRQREDETTE
jgi:hypothetical protein